MFKSLIKISNHPLLLPFYHLVSDKEPDFVKGLYKPKSIKQFKTDLDIFLKYFEPITLEQVIKYNKGKIKLSKPSFHLTFDDGLSNFYHIVAPILLKKEIPATVFLNTGFIDNKDLFYRYESVLFEKETKNKKQETREAKIQNFLKNQKPYLTLKQIKELQKQGFTFGAHSVNHPLYSSINLIEQIKQTKDSLQWVQDNLNEKYKVFSFPFHDLGVTKKFFKQIESYVDITFGTSGFNKDEISTNLHRLDMEKSLGNTKSFLIKEYIKLMTKKVLGRYKIIRK